MEKITISKNELQLVLNNGGIFAGKSKLMPIYESVKVSTHNNRIKVESMDGERYMRYYGTCECEEDTIFCVNGQAFINYVNSISGDTITIVKNAENSNIEIAHINGKLKLPTMDSDQFPTPKTTDSIQKTEIDGKVLSNRLKVATSFADKNDISSALGGVNIYKADGEIGVMASDKHRIYKSCNVTEETNEDFSATITIPSATALQRVCQAIDNISLVKTDTHLIASTEDFTFISRIISAKFPAVSAVLNREINNSIEVDKESLLGSLKRISQQLVSNDTSIMRIESDGNELKMIYTAPMTGKVVSESIVCSGEPFEPTGINVSFLLNAITNIENENVTIKHDTQAHTPFFFNEENEEGKTQIMVAPANLIA